jgi:aryl-alcohol dehydrogenase-like predicted oxidoreductase
MYFGPENLPQTIQRVEALKKIVPPGLSLPELALRYILSNPVVSTTIVGMRKHEHVRANIAASDAGGLDAALLQKLKPHRWDRVPKPWAD